MNTYDPATHTYFIDGIRVPGVTTVIGSAFPDMYKFVNENARQKGLAIHLTIELSEKDNLGDCPAWLVPYLETWKQFKSDYQAKTIWAERPVWSEKFRYGTRPDLFCEMKGVLHCIEIKRGMNATADIQTAAQVQAIQETEKIRKGIKRGCIVIGESDYKMEWYQNQKSDFSVYFGMLNLYNYKMRKGL